MTNLNNTYKFYEVIVAYKNLATKRNMYVDFYHSEPHLINTLEEMGIDKDEFIDSITDKKEIIFPIVVISYDDTIYNNIYNELDFSSKLDAIQQATELLKEVI